jgi:hypothetical protein
MQSGLVRYTQPTLVLCLQLCKFYHDTMLAKETYVDYTSSIVYNHDVNIIKLTMLSIHFWFLLQILNLMLQNEYTFALIKTGF